VCVYIYVYNIYLSFSTCRSGVAANLTHTGTVRSLVIHIKHLARDTTHPIKIV